MRLNADLITSFTTLPLAALAVLGAACRLLGAGALWCLVAPAAPFGFGATLSLLLLGLGGMFFATAALGVLPRARHRTVAGSPTGYVVRPHDR